MTKALLYFLPRLSLIALFMGMVPVFVAALPHG